ncbi:MAG TPA: helix-turn-helix transcriptional regulator [Nitrospiraceae bacterium]|jgi:antitoxin component HigA of HigAB toxin-antitoxin module
MDERVQILKDWMTREERGTVWMARKVGRTKSYISHILHERMPMTDKLARELRDKLGVPMPDSQGTPPNKARKRVGVKGYEEGRNG